MLERSRFFRSAAALDIRIPVTKDELKALLNDLVRKVDTGDLFVYYQVTRGTAVRDHTWDEMTGNLWVMLKPMTIGAVPLGLLTGVVAYGLTRWGMTVFRERRRRRLAERAAHHRVSGPDALGSATR